MASIWTNLASRPYFCAFTVILLFPLYRISLFHPLHGIPGPILFRMTELPMIFLALRGTRQFVVRGLHEKYGQTVRIGTYYVDRSAHPIYHLHEYQVQILCHLLRSQQLLKYMAPHRLWKKALHMTSTQSREKDSFSSRTKQAMFSDVVSGTVHFPKKRESLSKVQTVE